MPGTKSLAIASLRRAVDLAVREKDWVVVVCPSQNTASEAKTLLPALVPGESSSGGRTTVMPGGGRVSVMVAADRPFDTPIPLSVLFLGWDSADDKAYAGMTAWRAKAARVVDTGESRGA